MADVDQQPLTTHPAASVQDEKVLKGLDTAVNGPAAVAYTIPPYSKDSSLENATVDGSKDPAKTPFLQPVSGCKPSPSAPLTSEQVTKYESLLATVKTWTNVPDTLAAKAARSPITDSERMWLTKDCLLRYLRASKWVLATATTRLLATLSWRREWGVERDTPEYISEENATGKQVITGFDNQSRPCLYLNPHKQNTKGEEKQMHHLVFMLERCIDLMPPGQETLALLVNFKESRKGQGASIAQGRLTIYILQNHYPERLGRAMVQEVPWYISFFFKAIRAFIDPMTREKLNFDAKLRDLIPPEQLLKFFDGDAEFEYEHDKYWPAFIALANARKAEMVKRWESAGKPIGASEAYLKGEDLVSNGGLDESMKNTVITEQKGTTAAGEAPSKSDEVR